MCGVAGGENQSYLTGVLCGLLWKSAESFMQVHPSAPRHDEFLPLSI